MQIAADREEPIKGMEVFDIVFYTDDSKQRCNV